MILRRAVAAMLAAIAGGLVASDASAANKEQLLFFPMIAEAPARTSGEVARSEIALDQQLRPVAAITTSAPLDVPLDKGKRTFVAPAGSMFIQALTENGLAYCYAAVERPDSFFGPIGDFGVCLRDKDGDKVFDLMVVTDPYANRVRTPFEIILRRKDEWTPASLAYVEAPVDAIPKARMQMSWSFGKGLLGSGGWTVTQICWPEALVAPTQKNGDRTLCSQLQWPGEWADSKGEVAGRPLKGPLNQPEEVKWGPYTVVFTRVSDDKARFEVVRHMKPGPVVGFMSGRWRSTSHTWQVSVYQFREVDRVPQSALEVMLGMLK